MNDNKYKYRGKKKRELRKERHNDRVKQEELECLRQMFGSDIILHNLGNNPQYFIVEIHTSEKYDTDELEYILFKILGGKI
jgi:hypothetical protein